MLNLRPIMIFAAVIASYFAARDAVNFSIAQIVVALVLIAGLAAVTAFSEILADWLNKKTMITDGDTASLTHDRFRGSRQSQWRL
jgi:hypothetical protein